MSLIDDCKTLYRLDDWDESAHPRDEAGKFSDGSGAEGRLHERHEREQRGITKRLQTESKSLFRQRSAGEISSKEFNQKQNALESWHKEASAAAAHEHVVRMTAHIRKTLGGT